MCTSAIAHSDSAVGGQEFGRRRASAGCCARGRPPLPSPSPTLRSAARDTGSQRRASSPQRRGHSREQPTGERYNIRVRRREDEHVLHRAASNDVDNFSVDNPLWITAAAGCRSLRGRRRRPCGGSVNDGAEVQTTARQGRTSFGGMPKSSWAPPKGMRGKCERRGGNINADAANAEVFVGAMGARKGRLSAPWPRSHSGGAADVYIIIRVRASGYGESALNPPPPQHIPRRRSAPAPAQRRALPEHFLTPFPRTSAPPPRDDARLPTSQHIPRRRSAPAPAQRRALPEHFLTPSPRRRTPAGCAMHSSPPSQHIPRRRPPLAPAQRRALPGHFLTPFPRTSAPPPRDDARPPTSPPIPRRRSAPVPAQRRALPAHFRSLPAPTHARRLRDAFFADPTTHSPPKAFAPPLPFRFGHKKKRHRTVHVRCRMSRSTVVAVGHLGW